MNLFEWDENKNQHNIYKHQLDFNDVKEVFFYSMFNKLDKRKEYGEERWIGLGEVNNNIIVIVYTMRATKIRIISARKANHDEKKIFQKHFQRQNQLGEVISHER